jgi:hypothetical protein
MSENTFECLLTDILMELRMIHGLLEEKKKTPTSLGGWVEADLAPTGKPKPTQPANSSSVVDFCKRIEFCFKDREDEFIDFRMTRNLVEYILRDYGPECLRQFIAYCESQYEFRGRGIARPERMREYFQSWADVPR